MAAQAVKRGSALGVSGEVPQAQDLKAFRLWLKMMRRMLRRHEQRAGATPRRH